MAKNVMDQLIANGRVHRGLLGVTVQVLSNDLAAGLGMSKTEGALVSDVTAGGAADRAGLKRGDVIVGYQGHAVIDTNTLRNEIAATRPGSTVTLSVMRDGRTSEFKATLAETPDAKNARGGDEGEARGASGKFGLTIEPLTADIARQLDLDRDVKGVVITDVDPSSAAADAGLREGDVIQQVNGKPVRSTEDVRGALNAAGDKPAVLLIARGAQSIFVPLRAK
jgi:serine protease Do